MATEYISETNGNYYVAGTRVSLDSIVHAFRRGESPETICQNFEVLGLEEVYGAIAYYLANQAQVDAYLLRQGGKWAEGKRDADPLPANLREKLLRAHDELLTRPSQMQSAPNPKRRSPRRKSQSPDLIEDRLVGSAIVIELVKIPK
jgi:uncharacterized protein (DUF433 family)